MKSIRLVCISLCISAITLACDSLSVFNVDGSLSGLDDGKELTVTLNDSNQLKLTENGNFSFDVSFEKAQSYDVAIVTQPAEQSCTVNNASGSISDTNISNIQIVCLKEGEYTVNAEVAGLTGLLSLKMSSETPAVDGVTADTSNAISDSLTIEASGTYTFSTPIPTGNGYTVTIETSPNDQLCRVESGVGILESENVTVNIICTPKNDDDGDGLTNDDELNVYFTSPKIADTDGDGLSDYEEIVTRGFSEAKPYLFNPRIADLPGLKMELTSEPNITLNVTKSGSTETQNLKNSTTGTVKTKLRSDSGSWELGLEMETQTGTQSHGRFLVSINTSDSWTDENSTETYDTVEKTTGTVSLEGWEKTGGSLKTTVKFTNQGNRSFTITNLLLNATMLTSRGEIVPIGSLILDGIGAFPEDSLAPQEATGNLVFSNNELFPDVAEKLLLQSKNLQLNFAAYDVADKDGISMAFLQEQASAQGAGIVIDYGQYAVSQSFIAATNYKPDSSTVPLSELLTSILKITYEENTTGVKSLGGISTADYVNSKWVVLHNVYDGVSTTSKLYSATDKAYSLANINVGSGDSIAIMFLADVDGDGLGIRQELALGTDPTKADSDSDGRSDYEEVYEPWVVTAISKLYPDLYPSNVYSDPTVADIDGDGDNDKVELTKGTDPYNSDTDGDGTVDKVDTDVVASSFKIIADKPEMLSGRTIKLTGLVLPNSGEGICSITVVWGDNSTDSVKTILCADIKTGQSYDFEHTYASVTGNHSIIITSIDSNSDSVSKTYTVAITDKFTTGSYVFNGTWREALHIREIADVNGDGKMDIVGIGYKDVNLSYGTATGFADSFIWSAGEWGSDFYDKVQNPRHFIDVDSDGDLDLVGFSDTNVRVSINDGTVLKPSVVWFDAYAKNNGSWDSNLHIRTFGDVDGNGFIDFIGFGGGSVFVVLNNGTKSASGDMAEITDASQFKTIDFSDSGNTGTFTLGTSWAIGKHPRWIVDVNRDGKADILGLGGTGVDVATGAGDGTFNAPTQYLASDANNMTYVKGGWVDDTQYPRILADVDGDGDLDIVGFKDGTHVIENTSTVGGAVSFASIRLLTDQFSYSDWWRDTFTDSDGWTNHRKHERTLTDINGDGLNDIVGFGDSGVWVSLNLGDLKFADRVLWDDTNFVISGSSDCSYEWYHNDSTYKQRYYFTRRAADVNGDGSADLVGFGRCKTKAVFSTTIQ